MSYAIRWRDPRDPRPWLASCGADGVGTQWTADERTARRFGTRSEAMAFAHLWAPGVVEVVEIGGRKKRGKTV